MQEDELVEPSEFEEEVTELVDEGEHYIRLTPVARAALPHKSHGALRAGMTLCAPMGTNTAAPSSPDAYPSQRLSRWVESPHDTGYPVGARRTARGGTALRCRRDPCRARENQCCGRAPVHPPQTDVDADGACRSLSSSRGC